MATVWLVLGLAAPLAAKSPNETISVAAKSLAAVSAKNSSNPSFPAKLAGVLLGSVVGVPICVFRKPIDEEKYGTEQLSCGSTEPKVRVPAASLYFPFAVVIGVLEAPFSSLKHSCQNFNQPFSKEQFSLIERPENDNYKNEDEYSK